jgi:hypothetical protein
VRAVASAKDFLAAHSISEIALYQNSLCGGISLADGENRIDIFDHDHSKITCCDPASRPPSEPTP